MSMTTFYRELEAFLKVADGPFGVLQNAIDGKVLTLLGLDPENTQAADDFQRLEVMRSKRCGLVVYGATGQNNTADSSDDSLDASLDFSVLLLMDPHWGGRAFGERKWRQLMVLEDLIKVLNGGEVKPAPSNCQNSVRVVSWTPEAIEGLNAWAVICRRRIKI